MSEQIWANADIPLDNDKIWLWLGANTMLEYSFDEALELLTTNSVNAKKQLESVAEDMLFLRDQVVVTEVNIARCHNYGVLQRQKQREAEKAKEGEADTAVAA